MQLRRTRKTNFRDYTDEIQLSQIGTFKPAYKSIIQLKTNINLSGLYQLLTGHYQQYEGNATKPVPSYNY